MKRFLSCLWVVLVLLFAPVYGQPDTFREIDNKYAHLRIPSGWEYMEGPRGVLFSVLSPLTNTQDSFRENFNLVMVPLGDETITGLLKQAASATIKAMKSLLPDLTLEQQDSGTFTYGKYLDMQAYSNFSRLVWNWRVFSFNGYMYFFTTTGRLNSNDATAFREQVRELLNKSLVLKKPEVAE